MTKVEFSRYEVGEIVLGRVDAPELGATLDVLFEDPGGRERRVPAFTSGGVWRVRYSSGEIGSHSYRGGGQTGTIKVSDNDGRGLGALGPLRVAPDQQHLEHADGTPFLWLADTWWCGFTERLSEDEFRELAARRRRQGFSVVQIVAGLYPETAPFTPEAKSEAGWVWHEDLSGPNGDWFDEADRRIRMLLEHELVPLIVGSWGYYLRFMTVEQMLRHWRELIARWGAYQVVWCLVGEPSLAWYDDLAADEVVDALATAQTAAEGLSEMAALLASTVTEQTRMVNEVARGVRELEPFGRLITIHSIPGVQPWEVLDDDSLVDFWFLQTGHQGLDRVERAVNAVDEALARQPPRPVINGEPSYEGIAGSNWQDVQRFLFWSHLLSGAAGHSYGAHGIWGFNTAEYPGFYSGLAPTWHVAADFPGSAQVGIGRRLLLDLPWHRFEPRPEWVEPHQHARDRSLPYAAGIDDGPRVFYFPGQASVRDPLTVLFAVCLYALGNESWQAQLVNPRSGAVEMEFLIKPEPDGTAALRCGHRGLFAMPSWEDWVLILRPAV
jgi:hypothetical protein